MTRSILTTKAFRKDYKRSFRSGACDMELLQSVIDLLSQDAPPAGLLQGTRSDRRMVGLPGMSRRSGLAAPL